MEFSQPDGSKAATLVSLVCDTQLQIYVLSSNLSGFQRENGWENPGQKTG